MCLGLLTASLTRWRPLEVALPTVYFLSQHPQLLWRDFCLVKTKGSAAVSHGALTEISKKHGNHKICVRSLFIGVPPLTPLLV